MRKFIKLEDKKQREKIRKSKGVTDAMLSYALSFQRNSDTAVSMRVMAMENGGILFIEKEDWNKELLK